MLEFCNALHAARVAVLPVSSGVLCCHLLIVQAMGHQNLPQQTVFSARREQRKRPEMNLTLRRYGSSGIGRKHMSESDCQISSSDICKFNHPIPMLSWC